jgi:hypothetical protein
MNRLENKDIETLVTIFRLTDIQDVRASIVGSFVFRTQDHYLNDTNIFLPLNCAYVDTLKRIDFSLIGEDDINQLMIEIRDILYAEFQVRGMQDPEKIEMAVVLEILYYLYLYSKTNIKVVEKVDAVNFIKNYLTINYN